MKHTIVRYTLAIIGLFSVTSCTDYLDNAPRRYFNIGYGIQQ